MIAQKENRRTVLVCLALALVTLALYWPARHYDFVEYDDDNYVFENQAVKNGLTAGGLTWSFVDAHASNWHPLTWLSHMLDCQLFGVNAGPHHLVNVALHCANAVLLFLMLRAMTGAFWRSAFVAGMFAWHPLRVESVAWISERKDVLSGFFFMLTLWMYGRFARLREQTSQIAPGGPAASLNSRGPRFWYGLSLLFFVLGLLSKPMLVTTPCILLLLDFWPLRRLSLDRRGDDNGSLGSWFARSVFPLLKEKIPFFVLSLAAGLITFFAQKSSGAMISVKSEGIIARTGTFLSSFPAYLEKIFWPRDLAVLYLRPETPPVLASVVGLLILLGVSTIAGMNLRKRPYLAVGWLWFVIMLLPVSGLIQVGLQSVADRYTYLPAIGLSMMLAWFAGEFAAALPFGRLRYFPAAVGGAVLLALIALTPGQLAHWRNTETLMESALRVDPRNYMAHRNLGAYYTKLGRMEAARVHHARARELDP